MAAKHSYKLHHVSVYTYIYIYNAHVPRVTACSLYQTVYILWNCLQLAKVGAFWDIVYMTAVSFVRGREAPCKGSQLSVNSPMQIVKGSVYEFHRHASKSKSFYTTKQRPSQTNKCSSNEAERRLLAKQQSCLYSKVRPTGKHKNTVPMRRVIVCRAPVSSSAMDYWLILRLYVCGVLELIFNV